MKIRQNCKFETFNNKVVKCTLSYNLVDGDNVIYQGVQLGLAKCSDQDEFDEVKGKRISESRAIKLMVKDLGEFLDSALVPVSNFVKDINNTVEKLAKIKKNEIERLKELIK